MKKSQPRFDTRFEQCVDQMLVKREASFVDRTRAIRNDARPRDREAIGFQADLLHDIHVVAIAVIMVAGDVSSMIAEDGSWLPAHHIPNAGTFSIVVTSSFYLISGSRRPPCKSIWEAGTRSRFGMCWSNHLGARCCVLS